VLVGKQNKAQQRPKMSGRKATSTAAPARGGASAASKKKVDESKIEELFTQLTDPEDPESADWIEFEGISKLCELLGIDPVSDVRVLVLLWKLKIPVDKPGQIYRKDFVSGMVALNLENVAGLQAFLPSLDPGFLERQEFRGIHVWDLYLFCVMFGMFQTFTSLSFNFLERVLTRLWVSSNETILLVRSKIY
jgi:hypothetical protein